MLKIQKISFFSVLAVVLSSVAFLQGAEAATTDIDLKASALDWKATKVTGSHNGKIQFKSGKIEIDQDQFKTADFDVDMTTITVDDITDPKNNAKLVGHLKSDDFFSVEKNKTSHLKLLTVTPLEEKEKKEGLTHKVTGQLTIKGITQPVEFPAKIEVKDNKVSAQGAMSVDRTRWNIRYGSGKFFENLGDKTIHDIFNVNFKVVAAVPVEKAPAKAKPASKSKK